MAGNFQKKSNQKNEAGTPPIIQQKPEDHPVNSASFSFTAEQQRILGNVYRLILSWRRTRLTTERKA